MRSWGSVVCQRRPRALRISSMPPPSLPEKYPQKALSVREAEPLGGVGDEARPAALGWGGGGQGRTAAAAALGTPAGLAQQANGVMALLAQCLFRRLVGFAVPMRGINYTAPLGSQSQAGLKPSSVEIQNNGSLLKSEEIGDYKSVSRGPSGDQEARAPFVGLPLAALGASFKEFRSQVRTYVKRYLGQAVLSTRNHQHFSWSPVSTTGNQNIG